MVKEFAPAKVNLSLHVTGQRADGFHNLDSLVCFADIGDWITVEQADQTSLTIHGPFAAGLPSDDRNLVMRAAALFPPHCKTRITLDKNLPHAAGVGGGSADAAATLRAMSRLWSEAVPGLNDQLKLGADVPVCMDSIGVRMQGIGDELTARITLPNSAIILVNPNIQTATPPVFKALKTKANSDMGTLPPGFKTTAALVEWLSHRRNDLEAPAMALHPEISQVLDALAQTNPALMQMSGSGATCFGIFHSRSEADEMAIFLSDKYPGWWIKSGSIAA